MKQLGISQVDALFSNGSYSIEFLFCYKDAFDTRRLRRALRGLSSSFWPLFGEYREGTVLWEGYREEDVYDEEAIDRELDIAALEENYFETYSRFRLPELKKLFFMKVLRFRNGMVLVPKLKHLAGDGYSFFFFLAALASLSRPARAPFRTLVMKSFFKPHHHRTALREFPFRGIRLNPLPEAGEFTLECERIPKKKVRSAIREAASSSGHRISSNDVISAQALKTLIQRRREAWPGRVSLTIPIDVRRHIGEYGPKFLGNAILLHTLVFKKEELERSSVEDVAVKIRKSMPTVSKELYVDYLAGLENILADGQFEKFRPFDPSSECLVTNLSKMPLDKLDFGTGPPDLVLPLTVERNSAGVLADRDDFILRLVF